MLVVEITDAITNITHAYKAAFPRMVARDELLKTGFAYVRQSDDTLNVERPFAFKGEVVQVSSDVFTHLEERMKAHTVFGDSPPHAAFCAIVVVYTPGVRMLPPVFFTEWTLDTVHTWFRGGADMPKLTRVQLLLCRNVQNSFIADQVMQEFHLADEPFLNPLHIFHILPSLMYSYKYAYWDINARTVGGGMEMREVAPRLPWYQDHRSDYCDLVQVFEDYTQNRKPEQFGFLGDVLINYTQLRFLLETLLTQLKLPPLQPPTTMADMNALLRLILQQTTLETLTSRVTLTDATANLIAEIAYATYLTYTDKAQRDMIPTWSAGLLTDIDNAKQRMALWNVIYRTPGKKSFAAAIPFTAREMRGVEYTGQTSDVFDVPPPRAFTSTQRVFAQRSTNAYTASAGRERYNAGRERCFMSSETGRLPLDPLSKEGSYIPSDARVILIENKTKTKQQCYNLKTLWDDIARQVNEGKGKRPLVLNDSRRAHTAMDHLPPDTPLTQELFNTLADQAHEDHYSIKAASACTIL